MVNGIVLPVSLTKKDGFFIATCKIFNITVKGKTEVETKMKFESAVEEVINHIFKHMIVKRKSHPKRKEEEDFSMVG